MEVEKLEGREKKRQNEKHEGSPYQMQNLPHGHHMHNFPRAFRTL